MLCFRASSEGNSKSSQFFFSELNTDITVHWPNLGKKWSSRERENVCVCCRSRGSGFSFVAFSFQPCTFSLALPGLEIFLFFLSFVLFLVEWKQKKSFPLVLALKTVLVEAWYSS